MINTIKLYREEKGVTQEWLAKQLGVTRKTIISIENGKRNPSIELVLKMSTLFKVPVEKIFIYKPEPTSIQLVHHIRYIDLFCGIGGFRFAAQKSFRKFGITGECMLSSDIDEPARQSYQANFNEKPLGDITKINETDIPEHDLLFAGFPCQPFSIIGLGKGFEDTRGTLFFEIARILETKRPRAFVLENVKRLVSHENGKTLKKILKVLRDMGYYVDYKVLNALDYGLPQKRERIVIVGSSEPFNMKWPEKSMTRKSLNQILEKNVPEKYYASDEIVRKRKEAHTPTHTPSVWHENKSGNISSYPYSCALRAGASYNYLLVNGERRLTPREMLRLQGFPNSFKIVVNDSQIRKQAGNAVPVNMIEAVLNNFIPLVFQNNDN